MIEAAKHTPGPWTYADDGMGDFTIASTSDPLAIAAVVNGTFMAMAGNADEHEANARLIAAAPDMLAALQLCVIRDPSLNSNAMVMQAIAKATAA